MKHEMVQVQLERRIRNNAASKRWRLKHHEQRLRSNRNYYLKSTYGITSKDYARLYENQAGTCPICHRFFDKLDVDHNHLTGKVRGLLCERCNILVGYYELKQLCEAADKYLQEND